MGRWVRGERVKHHTQRHIANFKYRSIFFLDLLSSFCTSLIIGERPVRDRWPSALTHRSFVRVKRKLALQTSGILGSIPTLVLFVLDEHRAGVRSCVSTV